MPRYTSLATFNWKFFRYGLIQLLFLKLQLTLPSGSLQTSTSLPLIRNDKLQNGVQPGIINLLQTRTGKNNLLCFYLVYWACSGPEYLATFLSFFLRPQDNSFSAKYSDILRKGSPISRKSIFHNRSWYFSVTFILSTLETTFNKLLKRMYIFVQTQQFQ